MRSDLCSIRLEVWVHDLRHWATWSRSHWRGIEQGHDAIQFILGVLRLSLQFFCKCKVVVGYRVRLVHTVDSVAQQMCAVTEELLHHLMHLASEGLIRSTFSKFASRSCKISSVASNVFQHAM